MNTISFAPAPPAGMLNGMMSEADPRAAREQLNAHYAHGGGFVPLDGAEVERDDSGRYRMIYPGDPPFLEVARAHLRDEVIVLFEAEFVGIVQPDGSSVIARMD